MPRAAGAFGLSLLLLLCAGCPPGRGERCNPLLFDVEDQCSAGLACAYLPGCGVAFCCPPSDLSTTTVPMCTFPPDCSGASCCNPPPTNTVSNPSENCQPCAAPDAAAN